MAPAPRRKASAISVEDNDQNVSNAGWNACGDVPNVPGEQALRHRVSPKLGAGSDDGENKASIKCKLEKM